MVEIAAGSSLEYNSELVKDRVSDAQVIAGLCDALP